MHNQERDELAECCDCGATIAPTTDRAFVIQDTAVLCFDCAVKRGGVYDGREDRWTVPPRVADLPDERRPHP